MTMGSHPLFSAVEAQQNYGNPSSSSAFTKCSQSHAGFCVGNVVIGKVFVPFRSNTQIRHTHTRKSYADQAHVSAEPAELTMNNGQSFLIS